MESLAGLAYRLERFNAWRRGDDTIPQPCPTQLGRDIEAAVVLIWKEVDCFAQMEREK
jgi:hypothetical protein